MDMPKIIFDYFRCFMTLPVLADLNGHMIVVHNIWHESKFGWRAAVWPTSPCLPVTRDHMDNCLLEEIDQHDLERCQWT